VAIRTTGTARPSSSTPKSTLLWNMIAAHAPERRRGERPVAPALDRGHDAPRQRQAERHRAGHAPLDDRLDVLVLEVRERDVTRSLVDPGERRLERAAADAEPRRVADQVERRAPTPRTC